MTSDSLPRLSTSLAQNLASCRRQNVGGVHQRCPPLARAPHPDRIYETLRDLGYRGGYDMVRRYAQGWWCERQAVTAEAYVPLIFAPGEAYQFDWSYEVVLISGVTVQIRVAHMRLCHSRMLFVRAYDRENQEMVFDAHD